MTITTPVPATFGITRTQAAAAVASETIAERQAIAAMLRDERAAYSELLNQEGGLGGILHEWLANDVIPSIRKTGGYVVDEAFRPTARSIVNDDRGMMMLPILADISERGLDVVRAEEAAMDANIEPMHPDE